MKLEELISQLTRHSIPLEEWGIGQVRSVETLHQEILSGEAWLKPLDRNLYGPSHGTLAREIRTATVYIVVELKKYRWALVELRQVYPDGTKKIRRHKSSLSEKIKWLRLIPETALEAIVRAIREELGIEPTKEDLASLIFYDQEEDGPRSSESFPVLEVINHISHAFWHMPLRREKDGRLALFRRRYVEITPDGRQIFFGWRRIAKIQPAS